ANATSWGTDYEGRRRVIKPTMPIPRSVLKSDAFFYSTPLPRSSHATSQATSCSVAPQGTSLVTAFDLAQKAWSAQKPYFDEVALSVGRPYCVGSVITPARVQAQ